MIENEIKLSITKEEIKYLVNYIEQSGARQEFCTKQVTYRFDTENKELEKKGVFLRTRRGEKDTFTVKQKIDLSEKEVKSRRELEIDIDSEKLVIINEMLPVLGFGYTKTMEKYRMQWEVDDCKIAIDELSFGFYVEIEGDKKEIFRVVKDLGLERKNPITDTYWGLFEKLKKEKGIENKEDIRFETNYNSFLMSL